ncbi:hypothetical protein BKA70DRAFT_1265131 [Coprinopsis sp. MPI-PUGE-AT-0042]|nr:hypothetical protein BKA70DRAFT_1265131 [Coprinopsis sp. MPI-PUGE-AT-0042]
MSSSIVLSHIFQATLIMTTTAESTSARQRKQLYSRQLAAHTQEQWRTAYKIYMARNLARRKDSLPNLGGLSLQVRRRNSELLRQDSASMEVEQVS